MIQGQVIWFEIPVLNFERAIRFYTQVLDISIERKKFLEKEHGLFNLDKSAVKGVLLEKENHQPGAGIVLFFYVLDLSESLSRVVELGGKIEINKTLLKQKSENGNLTIKSNMIGGDIGYYAEIIDCEGNRICLYANS